MIRAPQIPTVCPHTAVRAPRLYRRARSRIGTAAVAVTAIAILTTASNSSAMAMPQPGVTDPSQQQLQDDQPGVSTPSQPGTSTPASAPPALTPPPRPSQQSPLGDVLPDPVQRSPQEYRPAPTDENDSSDAHTTVHTSLGQDLAHLHAPEPVTNPPKVIVPVAPSDLGVGGVKVARPSWFPVDAAWKLDYLAAEKQHDVDVFLNSVGFSPDRSTRMGVGIVVGTAAGAVCVGIPAAVAGSIVGGLIGGIIGGTIGATLGTLPVPVLGTISGGVAGTTLGAGVGAAIGATILGVPAAALGGTAGAVTGALLTGGDGSGVAPPPAPAPPPSLHDQFRQAANDTIAAGEQATQWVQAQPGGPQAFRAVVDAGRTAATQLDAATRPWGAQLAGAATQTAGNVLAAAKANPVTSAAATAAAEVVAEQHRFAPGQFGPATDAANGLLDAAKQVVAAAQPPQH